MGGAQHNSIIAPVGYVLRSILPIAYRLNSLANCPEGVSYEESFVVVETS